MSDYAARVTHADKYRHVFDQVEAEGPAALGLDVPSDGTVPTGEHVPTSLSGGLDPTRPPDDGSVLVREEFSVEYRHGGQVEIVHGSPGFEQIDCARRIDAQRNLRSDQAAGRLAPEAYGGDPIARALLAE